MRMASKRNSFVGFFPLEKHIEKKTNKKSETIQNLKNEIIKS